mmetsp:Transcript_19900/g.46456  ORF Transcript_19900/g.46456 Transcript_19900/m.46456 type:complete len:208 (+) Transcript_19900:215-838(+)
MIAILVFVVALAATNAFVGEAFSFSFVDGPRNRSKADLIEAVASGAPSEAVLTAVRRVERYSVMGGATLSNPLLQGNWLMVWTTSNSIAGKTRPAFLQTQTPPEQFLDVENGIAVNAETIWGIRNMVGADIAPESKNKVKVQFREFCVGPIKYQPDPGKFQGELSVTYLDEDMRISRGDLGNCFVLLRESTQRSEANRVWREWKKSW